MRRTMNIKNRNTYNVILAKPALESFIPGAGIQFKNVPLKADLYNWIPAGACPREGGGGNDGGRIECRMGKAKRAHQE